MAKIEILKAVDFINLNTKISCQLDYSIDGGKDDCVWRGVKTVAGKLFVNPDLACVGDLLHEAGHIATAPLSLRHLITGEILPEGDFTDGLMKLWDIDPRTWYCSDWTATGWGILACIHLGIDVLEMFRNGFGGGVDTLDLYEGAIATTGTRQSNMWMVQLYYLGMLERKDSVTAIAWDFDNLPVPTEDIL